MSTTTESLADLEAVCLALAQKRPVDPETARRVREQSEKLREEVRAKHGLLNIAVELVRETRDE